MSKQLFHDNETSSCYNRYRPEYTNDVAQYVISYARGKSQSNDKLDLMVEVGCGSGQATNIFAPFFEKVLATDVSPTQVRHAVEGNKWNHVTYQLGSAEKMPFEDSTADVVLSALSAHWFDLPKFLKEAERVLKPGGCLAVIGYFLESIALIENSAKKITEGGTLLIDHLMSLDFDGIASKNVDVKSKYANVFQAIPWHEKQRYDYCCIERNSSLKDIEGLKTSLGTFKNYVRHRLEKVKSGEVLESGVIDVERLKDKVKRMLQIKTEDEDDVRLKVVFNEFILVARKP